MGKNTKQRRPRDTSPPVARQLPKVEGKRAAWLRHGWRVLAIWGLVFVAYSNSFQGALVFDNPLAIEQDPRIRQATAHNVASILNGGYWYGNETDGLYRPLTTFSYLVNYSVLGNGANPAGYHWVNLAAHEINVALAYALGIAAFGETAPAWAMAAIWGLHPLLTESVTNIVGRADLLAAFGILAGLLCYMKVSQAAGRRRLAWLAGVAAGQAVALFSKESGVILPALMLLYDLSWSGRAAWRARATAYGALALPLATFFFLRARVHPRMLVAFAENPLVHAGFWTARITAVKAMGKLLWLFVWPVRLSADYSYNAVPLFGWRVLDWEDAKALVALAVCIGAAVLACLLATRWRRQRPMLFFLGLFFIAAVPTSNLIVLIGSILAERFFYLPSLGLAGLIVAAACAAGRRRRLRTPTVARAAWVALCLTCLALAARTYARNLDWKDELSLWTSAADVCPDSGKAHYNLGYALERLPGRLPEAITEYEAAVRIDPSHVEAHMNLGNALATMPGRQPQAIAEYQAALRFEPGRAELHSDLATILAAMPGRLAESIPEYEEALRLQPNNAVIHYNLANALFRLPGRLPEAVAEFQTALRINPDSAEAHNNLGNALETMPGRLADAAAEYQAALRADPNCAAAHNGLAGIWAATPGRLPDAIAEYRMALRIQPDNAQFHYNFATALGRAPARLAEAISEYEATVRLAPDSFEAHVNLAIALARTSGRRAEALAEYEAALSIRPDPVVYRMAESLRARR
jgi:tetratricopeptide (TPR) repeat protein